MTGPFWRSRRCVLLLTAALLSGVAIALLPGPGALKKAPCSLVVEDSHGELLGARVAPDGQWRFPFEKNIAPKFAVAIVVREDRRFWRHAGIDPLALARAVRMNLNARSVQSGASTITMQVIRLSRQPGRRSFLRKGVECAAAVRLTLFSSRKTILALYAAHAPFGGNVVGLEAAAWRYFGRAPEQLSWAETAMLAVLPNEPGLVHPGRNRERLLAKRDRLLHDLYRLGHIDSSQCVLACAEPLPNQTYPFARIAPHLIDRISKQHSGHHSRIRSTIDIKLQRRIGAIVTHHGKKLAAAGIDNAAALLIDVNNSATLAYIGNSADPLDVHTAAHVDCIVAPRSTGSVLKPFLYAAMLDCGELLPTQLIPDIPTTIGGFMPRNFNRDYEGAVPAAKALARSLNVPAVHLLMRYGVPRFHHTLRELGMTTVTRPASDYGISLILGGVEGSLWELCNIYARLAHSVNTAGAEPPPLPFHFPARIRVDSKEDPRPRATNPISPGAAWCMLEAMTEVERPGDELGWREFATSRRIAWKTGTSFGFRDGWAIGVTPRHCIGVWVGNASGEGRAGLIGIAAAAPILFDILNALPDSGWFPLPEQHLGRVAICRQSGLPPGTYCTEHDTVWAPRITVRPTPCPWHRLIHLDSTESMRVTDLCTPVDKMVHRTWFVLPPVIETYYRARNADYQMLPPLRPDCRVAATTPPLDLIYPGPNTVIYVPLELSGEAGRVVFEAAHRDRGQTIHWHLDSEYVGSTTDIHQTALNPTPGRHRLVLVDGDGNRLERWFEALENQRSTGDHQLER